MKTKYALMVAAVLMVGATLPSCSPDSVLDRDNTHTKVAGQVEGNYAGTLLNTKTNDEWEAAIQLTKVEADTIDAVTIDLSYKVLNADGSLKEEIVVPAAYLNVGKANDGYVFSSVLSASQKLTGRLQADGSLTLNVPLNKTGKAYNNASAAVMWTFNGTK